LQALEAKSLITDTTSGIMDSSTKEEVIIHASQVQIIKNIFSGGDLAQDF